MKNMVVLIDTNVLIDYLETREPYFEDACRLLLLCAEEKIEGYVAFHSIPNMFYIMRKTHSVKSRRAMLNEICSILTVTGASHKKVVDAINQEEFSDFEDCLQEQCAKEIKADYIVTRNINDFVSCKMKVISPKALVEKLEKQ